MKKNNGFMESFLNALNGIRYSIISERNLKFHLFFSLIVIFFSFYYNISAIEFFIVLILIFLVIIFEIVNTIIEKIMDFVSEKHDDRIKIIKDMSAGVVLLSAILAAIVGLIIFIPRIF